MRESNEQVEVSVVVAAYDEERWIGQCLASLAGQDHPSYEVIVIDDGSRDATARVARRAGALVVPAAHRGAGAARALGTRLARGRIVVYCDADEFYAPDYLSRLTAPIRDGRARRTFPGSVEWPNVGEGLTAAWAWVRGDRDGRPPTFGDHAELGRLLGSAHVAPDAHFAFTPPAGALEILVKSRWVGRGPRFARERPPLWHLLPPVSLARAGVLAARGLVRPALVHVLYDAGRLLGFCERRLRPSLASAA
jgi:glycosyltransferase involved in cell wall biosynthesis